jgi:hypothetical protein
MTGDPFVDVELVDATIDIDTGAITNGTPVFNSLIAAPSNGRPIRLFLADALHLKNVTITTSQTGAHPAFAVFARGAIIIDGPVVLASAQPGAAGAFDSATCSGATPIYGTYTGSDSIEHGAARGAGGGAFATKGGAGGDIGQFIQFPDGSEKHAPGGAAEGTEEIVPLRGGCGSFKTNGGGAIQLSSETSISVNSVIDARGAAGRRVLDQAVSGAQIVVPSGGGAGGAILLEAPMVHLGPQSALFAYGGSGASVEHDGNNDDIVPGPLGAFCSSMEYCGVGGNAAYATFDAIGGADVVHTTASGTQDIAGGGGGGGLGRIRINTTAGTFAEDAGAKRRGSFSSGQIHVR